MNQIAILLGLPEDATEDQITKALKKTLKAAETDHAEVERLTTALAAAKKAKATPADDLGEYRDLYEEKLKAGIRPDQALTLTREQIAEDAAAEKAAKKAK